jgi:hypothetical protein
MYRHKWIATSFITAIILTIFLLFCNIVQANDYNKAVIGHIVKENVTGTIDNEAVLKAELQKTMYVFAIQSLSIIESHLPQILDGMQRELEIMVETEYKEVLTQ